MHGLVLLLLLLLTKAADQPFTPRHQPYIPSFKSTAVKCYLVRKSTSRLDIFEAITEKSRKTNRVLGRIHAN